MPPDTTKPERPAGKPTDKADQFARFVEAARKLGCNEDTDRFEAQLGKIAKAKPAKDNTSPSE